MVFTIRWCKIWTKFKSDVRAIKSKIKSTSLCTQYYTFLENYYWFYFWQWSTTFFFETAEKFVVKEIRFVANISFTKFTYQILRTSKFKETHGHVMSILAYALVKQYGLFIWLWNCLIQPEIQIQVFVCIKFLCSCECNTKIE